MLNNKISCDTKDKTAEFDKVDIRQNKAMGILSYISFLVIVPLFGAQYSKFARFNANQGFVILLGEIALALLNTLFRWMFSSLHLALFITGAVFFLAEIFFIVLSIIGIINVLRNKAIKLPIVGRIKIFN